MSMAQRTTSEILSGMIEIANSSLDSARRVKLLMDYLTENWGVDVCALYTLTSEKIHLKLWVQNEGGTLDSERVYPVGEGLIGKAALDKKPIIIRNTVQADATFSALLSEYRGYSSLAFIPLMDDQFLYGILTLMDRSGAQWDEEKLITFSVVAKGLTGAVRNLQIIEDNKRAITTCERSTGEKEAIVKELSLLYELSQALMTTIKLDDLFHITLSAATMGKGLGFNRAMLFLVNESKKTIEGKMGVGPDSSEEAGKVWKELSENGKDFLDWVKSQRRWKTGKVFSLVDRTVREIKIPLREENGLLAQAVMHEKTFIVADPFQDPTIAQRIFSKIPAAPYALVPICGKKATIGVIMIDNLFNKKPITDYDLRLLTMLANQAGLAIENSRLYENLEIMNEELRIAQEKLIQNEKFATLGMMSSVVVHEIKNPLVAIGGFARRLEKSSANPTEKSYSKIIVKEVERLEKTLTDILIFSKEPKLDFQENNLNQILEYTLTLMSENLDDNGVQVEKSLSPALPSIYCDSQQIKQVFINLFYNAMETMEGEGGTLMVKTYPVWEDNSVVIEVIDTGKGIPPEVLNNIFNPFFTTRDKGVGLGLSIVQKIISYHKGIIEARNNLERGVTFTIRLPIHRNGMPSVQSEKGGRR
jgi:hypothetical protein